MKIFKLIRLGATNDLTLSNIIMSIIWLYNNKAQCSMMEPHSNSQSS